MTSLEKTVHLFKTMESASVISGVPIVHYDSYFKNFENNYHNDRFFTDLGRLVEMVLTADLEKCPHYIVFCGKPGSGKTHFMVSLYRALVQKIGYIHGDGPMFTAFTALATEIIGLFQQQIPIRTAMVGYTQAKWLFIDDFTASERVLKQDSLEFNLFRDIILDRYEQRGVLITSCNMTAPDFLCEMDRLFGGYVMSRMNDSKVIQFPDIDFRRVHAREGKE